MSEFTTIRILKKDYERLQEIKVHKTEPIWSIIERIVDNLQQKNNLSASEIV